MIHFGRKSTTTLAIKHTPNAAAAVDYFLFSLVYLIFSYAPLYICNTNFLVLYRSPFSSLNFDSCWIFYKLCILILYDTTHRAKLLYTWFFMCIKCARRLTRKDTGMCFLLIYIFKSEYYTILWKIYIDNSPKIIYI